MPGSASTRPAVLDVVRGAGMDVLGLSAEEGRLDEFYRELVGEETKTERPRNEYGTDTE